MADFELFQLIQPELSQVEKELASYLKTEVSWLHEASTHLIGAGGKRLRPAFTLLTARMYRDDLDDIIHLAAALELIHMASLVHDDVIDDSAVRRGSETVKRIWGNRVSIYAGNFILARSLAKIAEYNRTDMLYVLAGACMKICEGEIFQMMSCYNTDLGLKNYLRRIERKTALLISVSCSLGGMVCNVPPAEVTALEKYGYYLGMAFQITDDILDFIADEEILGKPVGGDVRQGVITLPAWYALNLSPDKAELRRLLSSPDLCREEPERIIELVVDSGGIDYAYHVGRHFAVKAKRQLQLLPDHPVKRKMDEFIDYTIDRNF